jgi:two-component system response regulator (stage 0 sporulation protein F)
MIRSIARPLRALVVDDESLIRWSIRETLVAEGFDVAEAATAAAAVRLASAEPFDVMVLDMRLPDAEGLELFERLRAINPDSKVILMSAFGMPGAVERGRSLGASAFLAKPFLLDDLVHAVTA